MLAGLVARRVRDMVIILFIVSTLMFFILHSIPGSPAISILGSTATESQIRALNHQLGFDVPVLTAYFRWLGGVVHGNLGYSISQDGSVGAAIVKFFLPTFMIAFAATVIGALLAVPLAIQTVARPRGVLSRLIMGLSSLGLAIPQFWLALVLILLLAVKTSVLPASGYVSPFRDFGGCVRDLALPVICVLAYQLPILIITLREGLAGESLNAYVRTARAKGASERQVMYRHLLPNAILPAITVIGNNFGAVLGGVIIIENIFVVPGLGYLLYNSIEARDYNLILGITLVTAAMVVLVNLAVDVLYAVLDPRVRTR